MIVPDEEGEVTTAESRQAQIATVGSRHDLEQALIDAAQAGSSAAFESLYALYGRAIYRLALSIMKNGADAEDATQDAFLRAYLALKTFRKDSTFNTWLMRIAINSSFMLLRKRRCRSELFLDDCSDVGSNNARFDFVDSRPNPEINIYLKQTYGRLQKSFAILPKQLRDAAELRMLDGRSIFEISDALGITAAATKARIFRARRLMKTRTKDPNHRPMQRFV
jgi:RNA polymerase sigma-70 factor (ECF subfamily)